MNKKLRYLLIFSILLMVFLVNYLPHRNQMPFHVDSWITIGKADLYLDSGEVSLKEPFSNNEHKYPVGSQVSLMFISSVTGLDFIDLAQLLPGIFYVIFSFLLYLISKALFRNELSAMAIMAFAPLALSNITMLGPFYLVPVTWGMLLSLLFFYLFVKQNYFLAFVVFVSLVNTHSSSTVFSLIAILSYFVFNRNYWSKIKYIFLIVFSAVIIFSFSAGFGAFRSAITTFFAFQKLKPYISIYLTLPLIFIILIAFGFYYMLVKEQKASRFLVPLFTLLSLNAFIYWQWQGFFLVYRRLFTFLFLMSVFFIGYAVFAFSRILEKAIAKKAPFVKKYNLIFILLLLLLLPLAVKTNLASHANNNIYVTNAEHDLFTEFGTQYPHTYMVTDHLQAYALPYYNLKPVQLSPAHGIDSLHFPNISKCYLAMDARCFADFMETNNYTFIYSRIFFNISYFQPFYEKNNQVIYEFNKEIYLDFKDV